MVQTVCWKYNCGIYYTKPCERERSVEPGMGGSRGRAVAAALPFLGGPGGRPDLAGNPIQLWKPVELSTSLLQVRHRNN